MLTPRQQQCLEAIAGHLAAHGHGPSYADLAAALGIGSRGCVNRLVNKLRERGFITWKPGHARSITLTGKTVDSAHGDLPIVRLAPKQAAEIDALVTARGLPSREAAVNWLVDYALYVHTHGSLPPCEARHAAAFANDPPRAATDQPGAGRNDEGAAS